MLGKVLLIFVISCAQITGHDSESHISIISLIVDFFSMSKVTIFCKVDNHTNQQRSSFKSTGSTMKILTNFEATMVQDNANVMIFAKDFTRYSVNDMLRNATQNVVVIDPGNQIKDSSVLSVDQRVFFLNPDTKELVESYMLNDSKVERIIGKLEVRDGRREIKKTRVKPFLERRSDLMGQPLNVVTDFYSPFSILDGVLTGREEEHMTPSGDKLLTLDSDRVNGLVGQLFFGILRKEMNFPLNTFVRSDRKWGYFVDGKWNGMVSGKKSTFLGKSCFFLHFRSAPC